MCTLLSPCKYMLLDFLQYFSGYIKQTSGPSPKNSVPCGQQAATRRNHTSMLAHPLPEASPAPETTHTRADSEEVPGICLLTQEELMFAALASQQFAAPLSAFARSHVEVPLFLDTFKH
jgi:hypothetical protein